MGTRIGITLLALSVLVASLLMGINVYAQEHFLGFPLAGHTPYDTPISAVFDHHIKGAQTATHMSEFPYDKDGVVMTYTGEMGNRSSRNNCYQQQNGYIFRIHGNYIGNSTMGKSYLCSDGHPGIDYVVGPFTDVLSSAEGTIIESRCDTNHPLLGKYIKIDHGNGYYTLYANLGSCVVSSGPVSKGQHIAETGSTTGNTRSHFHYQVRFGNAIGKRFSVDPYGWQGNDILWDIDFPACIDDHEPNDFYGKAVGPIGSGLSYEGKICNNADQDFFVINVAEPSMIDLSLSSPSLKDYQLELYNNSFVKVARGKHSREGHKSINFNAVTSGKYFVKIYGEKGDYESISPYSLTGKWPATDVSPPIVNAFSVTPRSLVAGNAFTISYTVSDTGGSGLKQVELWRTENARAVSEWPKDPLKIAPLSGNGPSSGSFADAPSLPGTYQYSIRVIDNEGKWNNEQNINTGNKPTNYGPVMTAVLSVSDTMPVVDFTGTPVHATTPITVRFSNKSRGYYPPLRYEWDFNNDGTVDSSLENPLHTFTDRNAHTVKLRVIDSVGNIVSLTRTNYITIGDTDKSEEKPGREINNLEDESKTSNKKSSARWENIGKAKNAASLFIDSKTISYSSDRNIVKLWTKNTSDNKDFLALFEINCSQKQFRMLDKNRPEKNPAFPYSLSKWKWRFILPESAPELIHNSACARSK